MLEHEPASWTAEVEHPASDQMPRMLEEGHGRVDAMQRLVQAMMHRSNRFWELALVSATQNGSSSAAPSTARAVSESRLPAHEAVGQKLLTATSSGAACAGSSNKKECGDCKRSVTATQECPNGTSLQPEKTAKPG